MKPVRTLSRISAILVKELLEFPQLSFVLHLLILPGRIIPILCLGLLVVHEGVGIRIICSNQGAGLLFLILSKQLKLSLELLCGAVLLCGMDAAIITCSVRLLAAFGF